MERQEFTKVVEGSAGFPPCRISQAHPQRRRIGERSTTRPTVISAREAKPVAPSHLSWGAAMHQAVTHPMHRLQIELILRLDRYEAHVLLGHRLGDRLGIDEVVLVRLAIRFYELCGNQSHLVSLLARWQENAIRRRPQCRSAMRADWRCRRATANVRTSSEPERCCCLRVQPDGKRSCQGRCQSMRSAWDDPPKLPSYREHRVASLRSFTSKMPFGIVGTAIAGRYACRARSTELIMLVAF